MNSSSLSGETLQPSNTNMYVCVMHKAYIVGNPTTLEDAYAKAQANGGKVYLLTEVRNYSPSRRYPPYPYDNEHGPTCNCEGCNRQDFP